MQQRQGQHPTVLTWVSIRNPLLALVADNSILLLLFVKKEKKNRQEALGKVSYLTLSGSSNVDDDYIGHLRFDSIPGLS